MSVDVARGWIGPAFDHKRLAKSLSQALNKKIDPHHLPFDSFDWVDKGAAFEMVIEESSWRCRLSDYRCAPLKRAVAQDRKLTSPDGRSILYEELASPDRRFVAYLEGYNVFVRSAEDCKGIQLSFDGRENHDYGRRWYAPNFRLGQADKPSRVPITAIWSPDSKYLFTYRIDNRKVSRVHLLQSAQLSEKEPQRALHYTYPYPLPGEVDLPLAEPVVFDVEARKLVRVGWRPLLAPLMSWRHPRGFWSKRGSKVYFVDVKRGYKTVRLIEADPKTGRARAVFEERAEPIFDHNNQLLAIVGEGDEIIWASERDGYNHLYLYDGRTGRLKTRLTRGPWVVRSIDHVDEKGRWLYFSASGKQPDRDPYLRHVYRVGLDGKGLTLLTPEPADHSVDFAPDGSYFVDNYSTIDTLPTSVVRRSVDGRVAFRLPQAKLDGLTKKGWRRPKPFRAKARDGVTDIYGVMFLPSNFDASKRYPVVENIYSGPHGFHTPKRFPATLGAVNRAFISQSLAELGLVVVVIDGLGQNQRGRAFRDKQYRNLADCGLPDRISALRQLAKRHPFLDLSRVGIFGFSAGGYASARALLDHPEFYKVAVSSAGNHDHRMDKLSWNERWMGHPVSDRYLEQSNLRAASKLRGKLLLAVGDLDTNVPPASTFALVHALIAANKDFDLMVYPNRGHYNLQVDSYFIRRRWDYFTRHLLGAEPPYEYPLKKPSASADGS